MSKLSYTSSIRKDYKHIESGKKLEIVLKYICKEYSVTRKEILKEINDETDTEYNSSYLSRMISGEKPIADKIIKALHEIYCINPDYLLCNSESLLDSLKYKYKYFNKFVDDWLTVTNNSNPDDSFVQITMDSNFYKFIFTNSHATLLESGKAIGLSDTIIYSKSVLENCDPIPEDYAIIPINKALKIMSDSDGFLKLKSNLSNLSSDSDIIRYLAEIGLIDNK